MRIRKLNGVKEGNLRRGEKRRKPEKRREKKET